MLAKIEYVRIRTYSSENRIRRYARAGTARVHKSDFCSNQLTIQRYIMVYKLQPISSAGDDSMCSVNTLF